MLDCQSVFQVLGRMYPSQRRIGKACNESDWAPNDQALSHLKRRVLSLRDASDETYFTEKRDSVEHWADSGFSTRKIATYDQAIDLLIRVESNGEVIHAPNESLDASGGGVFFNLIHPTMVA
jgi:hypothetical protein